jgi:hypothetical protein
METYLGSGGIAPRIINLGTRWRWVVSSKPRPLYPQGKRPRYPLDRGLGGPRNRSGRGGEDKEIACWETNHELPARVLVPILTELPRFLI